MLLRYFFGLWFIASSLLMYRGHYYVEAMIFAGIAVYILGKILKEVL